MSADGQGTRRQKNCRKFQPAELGAPTLQTDRRQTDRQTDGRYHIANVNVSSRSLIKRRCGISPKFFDHLFTYATFLTFLNVLNFAYVLLKNTARVVCRHFKQNDKHVQEKQRNNIISYFLRVD